MGIYSHLTQQELAAKRDQLLSALEAASTGVASVQHSGRGVTYQQNPAQTRRLLDEVQAELARRAGRAARGPIYMAVS